MKFLQLYLLLLLFIILPHEIFAQKDSSKQNRFSFGVSLGMLKNNWILNSEPTLDTGITINTVGYIGYLVNLNTGYALSDHWKITLAAEVQSKKIDYRIDGLHFAQDFDGTGFKDSHVIYQAKGTAIIFPVMVEYLFSKKKFSPFISLGASGDFILKQSNHETIYYSNGTTVDSEPDNLFRNFNVAVISCAGIYFNPSNRITISLSPEFRYLLSKDEENLQEYSFGAAAGINFHL